MRETVIIETWVFARCFLKMTVMTLFNQERQLTVFVVHYKIFKQKLEFWKIFKQKLEFWKT